MSPSAPSQNGTDVVLAELAEEFTNRVQAGEPVDVESYVQRYPEQAERLRRLLPALALLDDLGRSVSASPDGAVMESREGSLAGVLGDFRIIREVGKGGMGVVYEAEQVSLRRRVALKVLPFAATMDARHLQRFHNEAQAAACLHHTNIVPVHYVGSDRGIHFYAMQFIDGQPLSDVIRQLRDLEKKAPTAQAEEATRAYHASPNDAAPTPRPAAEVTPLTGEGRRGRDYYRKVADLGVQVAEALDYAHQLGIVHRDIKPGNLLLDGAGRLWVTDFGLAHMQHGEANLTLTGQALGTPRYMSPEQALAKRVPIDHRTDVYSLGATLYEMLTLRPAFESDDRQELLRQIAFDDPARPRRLERAVPAELEIIVLKAMEKRPQDRYATAQDLADDLERWLRHEPIRARRPSLLQRASKWGRRHKTVATASLVVLLMALAVAGYVGWTRHDRAVRRTASEKVILAALEDSHSWQEQRRLPDALSAARRANGLLAGADVDEALRQRVRARVADLELLERLENILLEMTAVKDGHFDHERADVLYGQTFRDAGLDVGVLSAAEAGERLRRSTVAFELAAIFDQWALIRRASRGPDNTSWKDFLHIAHIADPDAWRSQVREALERRDRKELANLAASEEVFHLMPSTLHVLAIELSKDKAAIGQVEVLLRETRRRHPNDFWANHGLAEHLLNRSPSAEVDEAIAFFTAAVALHPWSPGAHLNLGNALRNKGRLNAAISEFQESIRLKQDYAEAYNNLGHALKAKGRLDEAIAEFQKAIRFNKDLSKTHSNLADALREKGNLDEAIAECQEALRLKKDDAQTHCILGAALWGKGQLDEAIAEFREAIRLKKDANDAHNNLGNALKAKGQLDEAIAEYREALRLKKDYVEAHNNLGTALKRKGQLDEAIDEYREALRFKKDFAPAHCNLGAALAQKGKFAEALVHFRCGHELGSKEPHWPYPSAQWVRNCEHLAELDGKLPAILSGQKQPADTTERLALAQLCQMLCKKQYAAAARFFSEAFVDKPQLADDLNTQHRYNAACAAALAGCGQGKDADKLDAKERARLRQQALDWLRADLKAYRQVMAKSEGKVGPAIAERMQHWLQDDDFAGVRGDKALAQLPEAERKDYRTKPERTRMTHAAIWSQPRKRLAERSSRRATRPNCAKKL